MAKNKQVNQPLLPELRFPEFQGEGEWQHVPLGKHADIIKERAGKKKYAVMSIETGVGLVSQQEKFGRDISGKSYKNYTVIQKDDFAYNKSATKEFPEGFIAKHEDESKAAVPNSIFTCFRLTSGEIQSEYLYFQLLNNLHGKWLGKFITVGARAHGALSVNADDLLNLPVPVPSGASSIVEQQKIADCLGSLGDLISAHSVKLDALKDHKKGLLQQLFPAENQTTPKLRFPEFEGASEWRESTFGKLVQKAFYGTSKSTSATGRYPVIRMGNMTGGRIKFNNLVYIDLDNKEFQKIALKRGDILLNRTNSAELVGKISIFERDDEFISASYIVTFRLKDRRIDPHFCNYLLNTPENQLHIRTLATRSISQCNINPSTFRHELKIQLPLLPEQQKIADCLSALDALFAAQTEQIAALKEHKKGLMQKLFPNPEVSKA